MGVQNGSGSQSLWFLKSLSMRQGEGIPMKCLLFRGRLDFKIMAIANKMMKLNAALQL